jgi:cytidine deaminase
MILPYHANPDGSDFRKGQYPSDECHCMIMLTEKDQELIAAATEAIKARYRSDWQEVGAAMRTRDGRIFTGVSIDAYIGRVAVCAEAIAIGRAITEAGDNGIEMIVAVRHPGPGEGGGIAVVSPCGICRELIHDYDAKACVIVPNGKTPVVLTIGELLPNKYRRGTE